MASRSRCIAILLCLLSPTAAGGSPQRAVEYCSQKGFAAPIRQTLILIDEFEIAPNDGNTISEENKEWINLVVAFADPAEASRTKTFLPRERLAVYLLPRDGSEPQPLFVGCQPFYSKDETEGLSKKKSSWTISMETFFGTGEESAAEEYAGTFKGMLVRSIAQAGQRGLPAVASARRTTFAQSNLVASLQRAPRLVNLDDGIPRIVLLSDLSRFEVRRSDRHELGARTRGSLRGARQTSTSRARNSTSPAFQARRGPSWLISSRTPSSFVPGQTSQVGRARASEVLSANPESLQVFRGMMDYAGHDALVNIRLAVAPTGELVNSWISISRKDAMATPMAGSVICESSSDWRRQERRLGLRAGVVH